MTSGSKERLLQSRGWVNPSQQPKGPKGFPLCRVCKTECAGPRNTFCSEACVHWHKIRSNPGYARKFVEARDHGHCAICRLDTDRFKRALSRVQMAGIGVRRGSKKGVHDWREIEWNNRDRYKALLVKFHQKYPWAFDSYSLKMKPPRLSPKSCVYWHMDHILPVSEGGGECGLENLRTLCIGCHNEVTAQLRKRLKDGKQKGDKPPVVP